MTDFIKLIAADRPVRLLPDPETDRDARKLHDFWLGDAAARRDGDLSAVSNAELREILHAEGIDTGVPESLPHHRPARHQMRLAAPVLAASLAGLVVGGALLWQTLSDEMPVAARLDPPAPDSFRTAAHDAPDTFAPSRPDAPAPAPDPYVLARPDRPAAGAPQAAAPEPQAGLQAAAETSMGSAAALTRAEVHEMQRLLDLLGYGPLVRDGLPSEALAAALARFRADKGLDPDDDRPREALVMLRLAARIHEFRPPAEATSND